MSFKQHNIIKVSLRQSTTYFHTCEMENKFKQFRVNFSFYKENKGSDTS